MKGLKIGACCLLALILAAAPALAEEMCINLFFDAFVIDENGEVIIERGLYGVISPLEDSGSEETLYAVCPPDGGSFALCDRTGALLTDYDFDYIYGQDDTIFCLQNDRYGVLSETGKVRVPCEYTSLIANGEGGFLGLRSDPFDDIPDGVYVVDENGEANASGVKTLEMYARMVDGLLPALSAENQLYGYLGADGQWVIQPQFSFAGEFSGGQAQAAISAGSGLITADGNWLISPKYSYVDPANGDSRYIAAYTDSGVTLVDTQTWQAAREYENGTARSCRGYLAVTAGEETVLFGPDGGERFRLSSEYSLWDVCESGAVFHKGEWGDNGFCLFNMSGAPVGDGYQMITILADDRFLVATFDVEKTEYEGGPVLHEEVPGTMRLGCINARGDKILEMEYTVLYAAGTDRLWLETEDTGYLTDMDGEVIARYDLAGDGEDMP